jgi:leucine-rich repeat protein SHOC2
LQELTELSIETTGNFVLPEAIGDLSSLETLTLTADTATLPNSIGRLQRLRSLCVGRNFHTRGAGLSILPDTIGDLRTLQAAFLSNNSLSELPASVGRLSSLRTLNLNNNCLEALPEEIGGATALRELDLNFNRLRQLPRSMGTLTSLDVLKLAYNKITDLPAEIGNLASLQHLDLTENELGSLPAEIGQLSSLQELHLERNRLTDVPAEIGGLSSLTRLELEKNLLETLPREIGRLSKLTHLNVTANRIRAFPAEIGRLSALKSLRAKKNEVRVLPVEAVKLHALEDIEFHDDQPPVLTIASLTKEWDVFISHASTDSASVALPLADALRRAGLRVWLDRQEIRVGDSIRTKIDEGLKLSRFGIVILSPTFFERDWTSRELGALLAIDHGRQNVILPVWHNVDKNDVLTYSPLLGDIAATNTLKGLQEVAAEIVDKVLYGANDAPSKLRPSVTRQVVECICVKKEVLQLRDLLRFHSDVLHTAFGVFADYFTVQDCQQFEPFPGLVATANQSSADVTISSYVLFGSLEPGVVNNHGDASSELAAGVQLMKAAHARLAKPEANREEVGDEEKNARRSRALWGFASSREVGHGQPSVVVSGRRHALDAGKRHALNALNGRLSEEGIRIRTYDWLIDAAASVDREKARKNRDW